VNKTLAALLVLPLTVALGGCSSQQFYGVGQAWQRTECYKVSDHQERSRCLASASTSYEQYQRESKAAAESK
jgi:hypothetical protein